MPKQCKNCGDYFKTSEKNRQFCKFRCAIIYHQQDEAQYNLVARCYLCGDKVSIAGMYEVYWDNEIHEVCGLCAVQAGEQGGDSLYMEAVPTLLE